MILNDVVLPVVFLSLTDTPTIDVILILDIHSCVVLEVPLLKRLHFLSKALVVVKLWKVWSLKYSSDWRPHSRPVVSLDWGQRYALMTCHLPQFLPLTLILRILSLLIDLLVIHLRHLRLHRLWWHLPLILSFIKLKIEYIPIKHFTLVISLFALTLPHLVRWQLLSTLVLNLWLRIQIHLWSFIWVRWGPPDSPYFDEAVRR